MFVKRHDVYNLLSADGTGTLDMVDIYNLPGYERPYLDANWEEASDGDGIVCSYCGEDFCTLIYNTRNFKFCPHCGCRMTHKVKVRKVKCHA